MGIEGLENLTDNYEDQSKSQKKPRLTDAEFEAKKRDELEAERLEHNRRTAGTSADRNS